MAAPRSLDYEYSHVPLPTTIEEQSKGNVGSKTMHVATSSSPSLTEKNEQVAAQRPGWTSTYLQHPSLLGFAFAFLCLLLAVIVLAIVDAKQDGIASAKSSEHYLWTYGPTAVLVIVAALWNQVEYRAKHAMPWAILQQGSTPASKTLFMDYITPGRPEALWTSLRKSHWPVAITILNSFLLTLLTVASTGLLVLQSTPFVRHDCRLNVTDDYVTSFDVSSIGSGSVMATIAIANGTIPFPPGTSRSGAFQNLAPPTFLSGFDDIEVEGVTSTFYGGLDCEIATVTSGHSRCSDGQCRSINVTIGINTPTCNVQSYNLTHGCSKMPNPVSCDIDELWGIDCDSYSEGHDKHRLVFMIGQMDQNRGGAVRNETEALKVVTRNTTTIVCEAKYNITDTTVIMDQHGNVKNTPQRSTTTNRVQQFPAWDLVDGLVVASEASGLVIGSPYAYSAWTYFPWYPLRALFLMWRNIAHPSSDIKDPNVLQSHVNELFSMVTAQIAKQSLMRPSVNTAIGTCRGTEDRLRIRGLSLYLMGAILIILVLLTLGLLYLAPRKYSSRDPSSIGGLALVLSQSPVLLSQLSASGCTDLKTIKRKIANFECQALLTQDDQDWRFSIDLNATQPLEEQDSSTETEPPSEPTYWRPLSLRPVFNVSVIVTLLVLVVVLEVLYSVSQKKNGLAEVDPQQNQRFAWVYIPTVVMITVQTLVGMIAFSSLVIFPYFRFRSAASNTRDDILRNYAAETAIKSLWQSIAAKDIVVACMALAMLLTPLLTIAVSGLYTAQVTSVDTPITMSPRGQLNSSFLANDTRGTGPIQKSSATNIGLLLTQNFTFPKWTYDEIAIVEFGIDFSATMNSSTPIGSEITVVLPGIRSGLDCSIVPSVPTNFSDTVGTSYRLKEKVPAFEALGVYENNNNVGWPSPGMDQFGYFTRCGISESRNLFCGALGTSEVNWNAFTCYAVINQLDIEVTMDASTHEIIAATPNESTVQLFSNQSLAPIDLEPFPSVMIPTIFGQSDFGSRKAVVGYFDSAFQAVVHRLGTRDNLDSFPVGEYMNNEGIEIILAQLQYVHRTVTAQSANMIRIPLNTTSALTPPTTVNATLIDPHVYRLKQSAVSTRILDGLLIAIALCIALSFGLMDTRKVLPKNPASIAAGASLIAADAKMLRSDILPEGAQWYSDDELNKKKIWDGLLFRLGWWNSDGPSEQGGQGNYFKLDAI